MRALVIAMLVAAETGSTAAAAGRALRPARGLVSFLAWEPKPATAQASPACAAAAARACPGSGGCELARRLETGTWAVAMAYGGGPQACVALVNEPPDGGVQVWSGAVTAGYSQRYDEHSAPELWPLHLTLGGRVLPLISMTTMGHAGGGGSTLAVLVPRDGGLVEQAVGSFGGGTSLNTLVVTQGLCTDSLSVEAGRLVLRSCFDGALQPPQVYEWTGSGFSARR